MAAFRLRISAVVALNSLLQYVQTATHGTAPICLTRRRERLSMNTVSHRPVYGSSSVAFKLHHYRQVVSLFKDCAKLLSFDRSGRVYWC